MPDRPTTRATSPTGKDARRDAAREKARLMRELEARKKRRNRVLVITAGIVAVVLVIGAVAFAISRSGGSTAASATPPGVTADGGIVTGDEAAAHTVTIYQDYQCPACKSWEESNMSWLTEQREAGVTKVEYRPIAILNRASSGTEYSTRSANAAFCIAGQTGVDFTAFNTAMYDQQPEENGSGLTDNKLVSIAEDAGATDVGSCIASRTYGEYADDLTTKATSGVVSSTPTVLVDGEVLQSDGGYPPTQEQLATALGVTG